MTEDGDVRAHDRMRAELPELAADVLDGRARAELLAHVDTCSSCALELEELTATVDSLVLLGGPADPPVGFESRVFEATRRRSPRARRHLPRVRRDRALWRRPLAVVTSAAAVAVLAFGLGWGVHSNGASHPSAIRTPVEHPVTAPMVSGGRTVGMVSVYVGGPAWLSMRVQTSSWSGEVQCTVTSADGVVRTVGWFSLKSGAGAWAVPLPAGTNSVRAASLVGPKGTVLASARFTPAVTEA